MTDRIFILILLDQAGGYASEQKYDTVEELKKEWPHAQYQGDGIFEGWMEGYA